MKSAAMILVAFACSLAVDVSIAAAAQETVDDKACARLLPEIEKLEVMLAQQAKVRTSDTEAQRMQLVTTLLGLRYHSIESLQSSARAAENEESDIRGAIARGQAQLDALDEAAKSAPAQEPDSQHKSEKTEIEVNLKGLEEQARGIRERKSTVLSQLAFERHDIEKLEAIVRRWIDNSP